MTDVKQGSSFMQLGHMVMAGAFGLLGAILIVNTASMPALAHIEYGPALFPGIVGWALIGLSALAALDALRATANRAASNESDGSASADDKPGMANFIMFGAFVGAPLVYVALTPVLGFLLAMPLIFGGLAFIASRKPVSAILLGIGLTLFLHVVFYQLLRVSLPWGLLTPYAGILTWR